MGVGGEVEVGDGLRWLVVVVVRGEVGWRLVVVVWELVSLVEFGEHVGSAIFFFNVFSFHIFLYISLFLFGSSKIDESLFIYLDI